MYQHYIHSHIHIPIHTLIPIHIHKTPPSIFKTPCLAENGGGAYSCPWYQEKGKKSSDTTKGSLAITSPSKGECMTGNISQREWNMLTRRWVVLRKERRVNNIREEISLFSSRRQCSCILAMWLCPSPLAFLFSQLMLGLNTGPWTFSLTCSGFVLAASLLTSGSWPWPKV